MKRHPAYDPPEYTEWEPDPALVREYRERLRESPDRQARIEALSPEVLLSLYRDLLRVRLHDITLKRWVRRGILSKAWLGTGEEAVTVGPVAALDPERDVVTPMIRNRGAARMMGMALADSFRCYLGASDSPNGGRDLHLGSPEQGVIQPISNMGTNVTVTAGMATAFRMRGEDRVALTWIGDGATRTGECHEGANFAAVRSAPAVFVVQNNQVALGTRVEQHTRGSLAAWPDGYDIPSWRCDGNNVLDVHAAALAAVERCRRGGGPAAVVCETFRMGGHATHDEGEARLTFPDELFERWGRRDPIGLYEAYLAERGLETRTLERAEDEVRSEVEEAEREALESRSRRPRPEEALYEGISEGGTLVSLERRPV